MTNKSVLIAANQAVTNADNEGFVKHCTDDIVWHFIGDQTIIGKENVRKYMDETYIEPPKFDVEFMVEEGDFVTAVGKISLKEKSGEWKDYSYCDVWRLENGKLAELRAFVIPES